MLQKYPLQNAYWADKRADMSKINVPAYVLASYSTGLYTLGSFRGFEKIPHDNKWYYQSLQALILWNFRLIRGVSRLRVHGTQEWYDLYSEACIEDLQLNFDRYPKDQDNGCEKTPRVRLSVLRYNAVCHLFAYQDTFHAPY